MYRLCQPAGKCEDESRGRAHAHATQRSQEPDSLVLTYLEGPSAALQPAVPKQLGLIPEAALRCYGRPFTSGIVQQRRQSI